MEAGVGRGSPSWGRVKVTPVYWSQFWTESARALGWSAPVGASSANTPAWCSLRKRRLPRRISRPYGQCRRAAFMKQRYLQFNKVSAVSVVVLAGAVVVSVAVVVGAVVEAPVHSENSYS